MQLPGGRHGQNLQAAGPVITPATRSISLAVFALSAPVVVLAGGVSVGADKDTDKGTATGIFSKNVAIFSENAAIFG